MSPRQAATTVSAAADRGSLTPRPFWPLRFFFFFFNSLATFVILANSSAQTKILLGIRIPLIVP